MTSAVRPAALGEAAGAVMIALLRKLVEKDVLKRDEVREILGSAQAALADVTDAAGVPHGARQVGDWYEEFM
jgi:hypothetical protein